MNEFPLNKVYRLIEPGPVVLVTTMHEGCANIMTMSWHLAMEFEPPLIGCVIDARNYSFKALQASGECVIAIPTVDFASKVVDIGNCSGQNIDKLSTFGLTPVPADKVAAPLIRECLANLECRVTDTRLAEQYNFFILEVVKAWIDPQREERRTIHANGDGTFVVDGETLDLKNKMLKWDDMLD